MLNKQSLPKYLLKTLKSSKRLRVGTVDAASYTFLPTSPGIRISANYRKVIVPEPITVFRSNKQFYATSRNSGKKDM